MSTKRNSCDRSDVSNKKVRNEKGSSSSKSFDNFPTYEKLNESLDFGKEYEQFMCCLYALKFSTHNDVVDFEMTANNKKHGVFDDVELRVTFRDKKKHIYLLQLKHKEGEKPVTVNALTTPDQRGPFCLAKYLRCLWQLETEDATCILYTNTGAYIRPHMHLTDGFSYNVLVAESNLEYEHLIANTKANASFPAVFHFGLEGNTRKRFYFFTQQENIHTIKPKVENLIKKLTQVDIYEPFVLFMQQWWSQNFVLTKHEIVTKLAELVCSPYIKTISGKKCNKKSEQVAQIIKDFDMTLVADDDEEIVREIWSVAEEKLDLTVAMKKFGLTASEPSPMQKTKVLWHLGLVPLLIKYDTSNHESIKGVIKLLAKSWGNKNVVLLGNVERKEFDQLKIFETLSDVDKLETIQNISDSFRISLQGRPSIPLTEAPNIASIIGIRELLKMSQEESLVVDESKPSFDPFYIPRTVSSTFLKTKFVLSSYKYAKDLLLIIRCEENSTRNLLDLGNSDTVNFLTYLNETPEGGEEENNRIVLCTARLSVSDFEKVCQKSKKAEIYVIQPHDDDCCRLLMAKGNTFLSRKVLQHETFTKEDNIFVNFDRTLNLICAPPGMGKSLFFQKISTKCPPHFWSVHVTLITQKMFLRTRPIPEKMLHHFLGLDDGEADFVSRFKKFWPRNMMQFFLDGLDEVELTSVILVLDFAKFLSSEGATVWISTRENLRDLVCSYLYVVPIEFQKFSREDQKHYINDRLKDHFESDDVEKITKTVFESADVTNSQQLLGIPLQLYIITEMLRNNDDASDRFNDQNIFVLTKMYKLFFDGKKRFSFQKLGIDEHDVGFSFDHHLKLYQLPALQACLEESDFTLLDVKTKKMKPFLDQVRTHGDKYGIIREVFGENQTVFVHQTYAEYFACLWLKKHPEKVRLLREVLFLEKYQNLRLIFDIMLAEDNPLHLAAIYRNVDQIRDASNCFGGTRECGRTILHVLFSHGTSCPVPKLKRLSRENESYISILEAVLEKVDDTFVLTVDDLFGLNSVDYALKSQSIYPLEKLLENRIVTLEELGRFLDDTVDLKMLAYYCSQLGYPNLLSVVITKQSGIAEERFDEFSLLHAAVLGSTDDDYILPRRKNIDVIQLLVKSGCPLDDNNSNILDYACQNGCYDVLPTLIDLGASCNGGNTILHKITEYDIIDRRVINLVRSLNIDINAKNDEGMTALHIACKNQRIENITELLNLEVEVNTTDEKNRNALHYAALCSKENTDIVNLLIQKDVDVDACDNDGTTALQMSCFWGHTDSVKILLKQGANPNHLDNYKTNALFHAIQSFDNRSQMIDLLIEFGVDVNARTQDRSTILHYACRKRNVEIVRKLLTLGVDVLMVDDYDMNALHQAVDTYHDNTEIIELLIENGISVNSQDEDGRTPLHIACQQEQIDNVKKLLQHGVNFSIVDNNNANVLHYAARGLNDNTGILNELLQMGFDVNAKDSQGRTAIHFACRSAIMPNVKTLLEKGADANIIDVKQRNTLHYAAEAIQYNVGVIELLTTNYDFDVNGKNDKGQTALHLSCENGPVANAKELVRLGVDVNAVDNDGMNASHYAAKSKIKDDEVMSLMLSKGLGANSRTTSGITPLHLACMEYHVEVVNVLINSGAAVEAVDDSGMDTLHYASQSGKENKEIINLLITKGLNVNSRDCKGRTPLHFASHSQVIDNLQLLIRQNADVHAVDNDGMSLLHYAALSSQENLKIINYLVSNVGLDLNVSNRDGETPLHLACQVGNAMNIEVLLELGADFNKLTNSGKDIRHYAAMSQYSEVVFEELLSNLQFLHL